MALWVVWESLLPSLSLNNVKPWPEGNEYSWFKALQFLSHEVAGSAKSIRLHFQSTTRNSTRYFLVPQELSKSEFSFI